MLGLQSDQEQAARERTALEREKLRILNQVETKLAEAEAFVSEAKGKASRILARAEEEALQRLNDTDVECQALLRQAQSDSEETRTEASRLGSELGHAEGYQQGLDEGLQEGRQRGHIEGHQLGQQEGQNEFQTAIGQARELAKQIAEQRHQAFVGMEPQVIQLAFRIASKIIHASVRQGEAIRQVVHEVLDTVGKNSRLRFHVHPKDLVHLEGENLFQDWPVEIESDETIEPGGCLVETEHGHIDARIDKHLERIEDILGVRDPHA